MTDHTLTDEQRKELEAAILARLEDKSVHEYQWPRWAASYEASMAAAPLIARMVADAEQRGREASHITATALAYEAGQKDGRAEALREAADDLYRGDGPDAYADSDVTYAEWLYARADRGDQP